MLRIFKSKDTGSKLFIKAGKNFASRKTICLVQTVRTSSLSGQFFIIYNKFKHKTAPKRGKYDMILKSVWMKKIQNI